MRENLRRIYRTGTHGATIGQRFLALTLAAPLLGGCADSGAERRAEIYELRDRPGASAVSEIREHLTDADRDVRATALNVLVGLGVEDAGTLALSALSDEDGFVRATAAKLLGDTRDRRWAEPLAERLLGDSDPVVRLRAATALRRVGGPRAVDALTEAVGDPEASVRKEVIDSLRVLGPAPALASLARVLREDPEWEVRVRSARALGVTGDPGALPALREGLDDANEFVRSACGNALRVHEEVVAGRGG